MALEDIGFYTLEDYRAQQTSGTSPLWRGELLLTGRCNFSCPYCRDLPSNLRGDLSFAEAEDAIRYWCRHRLKNLRLSGGEPTLWRGEPTFWPRLTDLIRDAIDWGVERVAVSTNGSAALIDYIDLVESGISDFSISLDACCASTTQRMSGIDTARYDVCRTIRSLSRMTYVTVGITVTGDNVDELSDTIALASSLGVADIRVIPAAQDNRLLTNLDISDDILDKHPILKYRVNNFRVGRNVRGLRAGDCRKCHLVLDDAASAGGYHFPCIIYLREGGPPIGNINYYMREERVRWFEEHDSWEDPICRRNCLDVCIDYNNRVREFKEEIR